ncbi:UTRA domain-containing protein [Streptomyces sp. NPDC032161]|uniref:UTRA domain-containing protein n=1 Tax=unclassified Streptomyces TaxID=2593676 RepID=UPI0033D6C42B
MSTPSLPNAPVSRERYRRALLLSVISLRLTVSLPRESRPTERDSDEVAFIADRVVSGRAHNRGDQTQTVLLVAAPPVVAAAHGLPVGAPVYARARLVKEDGRPTHSLTSYYRPEHVEGTRIVDPSPGPAGPGGGFRVLYDAGYEIDHMKEELFARASTPEEVKLLMLPNGEPVVELRRTTCTANGTVVEFAIGVHAASRFTWSYEFKVPDSARSEGDRQ